MLAYTSGVGVVCALLSVRAVRAEVGDQSVVIGRQMAELADSTNQEAHRISVNGQSMLVGSAIAKDSPRDVLDRFEKHCRSNAAQSPDEWNKLADKSSGASPEGQALFKAGLLRSGGDDEGTVLCFVKSSESKATVGEAFKGFSETGELGAIGQLRYAYAKKTKSGNTHVLTGWTAEKFNLKSIMPEDDKDVAGADFSEIPRPANAQRILSTRVEGTPFGVNIYRTDQAPEQVAKTYDEALTKRGWVAVDAELSKKPGAAELGGVGHLYEKDGVVLTLAAHVDGGKTFATLGLAGVQADRRANR